jgi:hypothetical protein
MSDEKEKEPRKKPLENSSETVKVRISGRVLAAARAAKAKGRYSDKYENEFMGYLVELGLQRYEAKCLPVERGDDLKASALHDKILGSKK